MKRVRVYEISRQFGGYEGGGWWYDHFTEQWKDNPLTVSKYRQAKKIVKRILLGIDGRVRWVSTTHVYIDCEEKQLLIVIHPNLEQSYATLDRPISN
jgi:hypothetical protein